MGLVFKDNGVVDRIISAKTAKRLTSANVKFLKGLGFTVCWKLSVPQSTVT